MASNVSQHGRSFSSTLARKAEFGEQITWQSFRQAVERVHICYHICRNRASFSHVLHVPEKLLVCPGFIQSGGGWRTHLEQYRRKVKLVSEQTSSWTEHKQKVNDGNKLWSAKPRTRWQRLIHQPADMLFHLESSKLLRCKGLRSKDNVMDTQKAVNLHQFSSTTLSNQTRHNPSFHFQHPLEHELQNQNQTWSSQPAHPVQIGPKMIHKATERHGHEARGSFYWNWTRKLSAV